MEKNQHQTSNYKSNEDFKEVRQDAMGIYILESSLLLERSGKAVTWYSPVMEKDRHAPSVFVDEEVEIQRAWVSS